MRTVTQEQNQGAGAFAGMIAVVTGAGSGVGRAVALALAERGAALCLIGRRLEPLEAVAQTTRAGGRLAVTCAADVARDADIDGVLARLRADFGHADVLIHSAGTIALGTIEDAPVEDLDRQYETNVRGPYLLTKALLPLLKARQGQVVFVNSTAGLVATAGVSQYAASKHALRALAESLREEVNPYGVRVLSVFLGRTATPMQAAVHEAEGKAYLPDRLIQPEDVAAIVLCALGLPRTAEVTEIRIRPLKKPK